MSLRQGFVRQFLPFLVLTAALLLWAAAVLLAPSPHKKISARLALERSQVEEQLDEVTTILNTNPEKPFSVLPKGTASPYYIYQQEQPWFWSDYHLLPSYSLLRNNLPVQFLNLPDGQFLVFQRLVKASTGDYTIFVLLPLQSNLFEVAEGHRYNPAIFSSSAFSISGTEQAAYEPVYLEGIEEPVFYLSLAPAYARGWEGVLQLAAWLLLLGLIAVGASFWSLARSESSDGRKFWLFSGAFLLVRVLMLLLDLPYRIYPIKLFNPEYYASSVLNPSLADYLLNMLFLLGLMLLLWPRRRQLMQLMGDKLGETTTRISAVFWVLIMLLLHYYLMRLLFFHAQFSLDITQEIAPSLLKVMAWVVVAMVSTFFFMATHPVLNWLRGKIFTILEIAAIAALFLVTGLFLFWIAEINLLLLPVIVFYYLLYRLLDSPGTVPKLNYSLFIYLFGAALVCALSASLALHSQRVTNRLADKERFATQILTERDLVGEYLLQEAAQNIQNDPYIINRFLSPLFSKEGIEQKIRRQYLSRFFDKYETSIRLFGLDGMPLNNQVAGTYFFHLENAKERGEPTEVPSLLRLSGQGASDYRYQHFIPISYQGTPIGYIMMDLRLKRYQPRTRIYPELFSSQNAAEPIFERNHYAIFVKGKLRYDAGEYDYMHGLPAKELEQEDIYKEGIIVDNYHHFAMKGEGDRVVVISSQGQPLSFLYANFSFLLLLLLFCITLYILGYLLSRRLSVRFLNFTTKIQLYLNFAIFVPLLIITISTLSFISQSYRRETEKQFIETAESISRSISEAQQDYQQGIIDREALNNSLDRIARITETDIHLFDTRGMLLATSQPAIYYKNYLASVINPRAQAHIVEHNHRQFILTETVGRLQYRSAYVAVRSNTNGKLLGIVSIPFFDSGYVLQRQLSAIFAQIVSIFATLFLAFLLLLYVFSKELTAPLRYIADRLRLISLTGKNEPLSWPAEDEIGMLVREYNHMLLNLQASKEALSRSEKESAWREMAKQVAHEIKNPLTPMRLSLQHLNRRLQDELEEGSKARVNKSFQSILEQIDTLSEIATSFSAFAKMPAPRQELFDVGVVLSQVVSLYTNEQHYRLEAHIPEGQWLVQGDEQMMQRTFNNLILNGIQAVPGNRQPRLQISLQAAEAESILIKIRDNGTGIPETIRNKVFVPNFSTKNSGSGLGLAIAKRGIEHAGGRIWFESLEEGTAKSAQGQAEAGTTFFVELPLYT